MTPDPWPAHLGLDVFDELDSTQTEARRRIEAGDIGPGWIVARRQTAGHGRRGRAWDSPDGNLMATWYGRPSIPIGEAPQVSFVAALAVADMIERYVPGRCTLKWPNDPLLDGAKVAGILPDSAGRSDGRLDWLMVGFGVNLAVSPIDTPYPATSIGAATAGKPDPDVALSILSAAWERRMAAWRAEGFSGVRKDWLARAHGIGKPLEVRLPNEAFTAVFEGLDQSGALLARLSNGSIRHIAAGDVFPVAR